MPTDKDFKRLVRGRMQKTGESYTTARAHLLAQSPSPQSRRAPARALSTSALRPSKAPSEAAPAVGPTEYARLAGQTDAVIKARTGCTWERWVHALDHVGASEWAHRDIARYVHEKYKIPGWWAQSVTTGYERIKGLREIGQRRGGSFEASKSRTFAVPIARLYRAFRDARTRARWLPDVALTIRTATPNKSMRITWPDGTSVSLWFQAPSGAKSQVSVQHEKLPDRAAQTRLKQYWTERLDALREMLAAG